MIMNMLEAQVLFKCGSDFLPPFRNKSEKHKINSYKVYQVSESNE